jgi:hypothetical protein
LVVDVQEAEELAALPVPSTLSLRLHSLSFSDSELQERDTLRACLRSGLLQSSGIFLKFGGDVLLFLIYCVFLYIIQAGIDIIHYCCMDVVGWKRWKKG